MNSIEAVRLFACRHPKIVIFANLSWKLVALINGWLSINSFSDIRNKTLFPAKNSIDRIIKVFFLQFFHKISEPSVRGMMSTIAVMSYNFGIFIVLGFGLMLPWRQVAFICALFPFSCLMAVLFVISFIYSTIVSMRVVFRISEGYSNFELSVENVNRKLRITWSSLSFPCFPF